MYKDLIRKRIKEKEYADLIRQYDVLITMWDSAHAPNELAENPGNPRYICNIMSEILSSNG